MWRQIVFSETIQILLTTLAIAYINAPFAKKRRRRDKTVYPTEIKYNLFSAENCYGLEYTPGEVWNDPENLKGESTMPKDVKGSVLVVGGGIAGMQSALDLANSGYYVYLLEKSPSIGGVMSQLDKTFPTNDCAM
jgi:heterodisulfide reductase subunit A